MKIGLVGLPNVGKSTLFNALTKNRAPSANYPFCTIEPNVGIVTVPDARVDFLGEHYKSKSIIHTTIEFVDIAGIVKGAAAGEGLGNKFLANIREADAILHVVRAFDNSDIIHVDGTADPIRDIETINVELILADAESVAKQVEKATKNLKAGGKDAQELLANLQSLKTHLESGQPARTYPGDKQHLITQKPVIYAINGDNPTYIKRVEEYAAREKSQTILINAKIEEELSQLGDGEELQELKELYEIQDSGLDKLIKVGYDTLNLISYITAGEQETRAWQIKRGTKAPQAAGKIHTDFERGFIRAEVVSFKDFQESGTLTKAKEKGLVRSEGKEYVVQDGDVVLFKFNV